MILSVVTPGSIIRLASLAGRPKTGLAEEGAVAQPVMEKGRSAWFFCLLFFFIFNKLLKLSGHIYRLPAGDFIDPAAMFLIKLL